MEKKAKKLQLNRETIRSLSDESLGQVAGGKKKDLTVVGITCQIKTACVAGCSAVLCQSGIC
jgi:hypothetical protein